MKNLVLALLALSLTLGQSIAQEIPYFPAGQQAGYASPPQPSQVPQPQYPGVAAGSVSQAPPMPEVSNQAAVIDDMEKLEDRRKLKVGDVISFRIVEEKTPPKTLRVMASGEVLVPHIGLVVAKDFSMKQLAYVVKRELEKEYFKRATVIIALDQGYEQRQDWQDKNAPRNQAGYPGYYDPNTDQIVIFGQVGRQGRYNIPNQGAMTISTAILQAGGFARFANKKKVRIYRKIPGDERNRRVILVDVDRIMRRGDLNKDIELRPDDVIIVPEKIINL